MSRSDPSPLPAGHPHVDSGVWADPDQDPRTHGAVTTDERSTLLAYLTHYRLTVEVKCAGLDDEQLTRRSVPPSTMSLLGLVRHLADVERNWFRRHIGGGDEPDVFSAADRPDNDFDAVAADPALVADAFRVWRLEIAHSERVMAAVTDLSTQTADGTQVRDIVVHMIEEYARHCGHADLLRQCIDGRAGQ